jgi:hypothetical protein
MEALLKAEDESLRREALRSLPSFNLTADQILPMVTDLTTDPSANVRAQLIRTLEATTTANILWAQQALSARTAESFLAQWKELKNKSLDSDSLVILSDVSKDDKIKDAILPCFRDPEHARHIAHLAMENIADLYAPHFGYPIAESVQNLIKSTDKNDIILGLQLGRAYRITHLTALAHT